MTKKVFSFDAETDGLWGDVFSIGAIVYEYKPEIDRGVDGKRAGYWQVAASIVLNLGGENVKTPWVRENVLPNLESVGITHVSYEDMLRDFSLFYMKHKEGADCITHMGYIVEAQLLREMHRLQLIGDWDAPYPLYDISGNLQAAGEDATSPDKYITKNNIKIPGYYGGEHNPLYDSAVAALAYIDLMNK
jgi:hypothetical protein